MYEEDGDNEFLSGFLDYAIETALHEEAKAAGGQQGIDWKTETENDMYAWLEV